MRKSWLTLAVVPAALLLLIMLPFFIYWSSLPDPMAIHWGIDAKPDYAAPRAVLVVGLCVLYAAMAVSVQRALTREPYEGPSFLAGLIAVGVLLVGVSWASVLANRDVAQWSAAGELGLPLVGGLFVVAMAAGFLAWLLTGGRSPAPQRDSAALPSLDLVDPANAVWSGRGAGRFTTGIACALLIAAAVIWGGLGLMLAVIAIVGLLFAAVRVTVSERGAVVSLGWWGFPSWTVPMDEIARADVEELSPMAYGGWGYRVRPGVRAIVVRSGEALRLIRDNGADLVYTVDEAETGAGLINDIVSARNP